MSLESMVKQEWVSLVVLCCKKAGYSGKGADELLKEMEVSASSNDIVKLRPKYVVETLSSVSSRLPDHTGCWPAVVNFLSQYLGEIGDIDAHTQHSNWAAFWSSLVDAATKAEQALVARCFAASCI